MASNARIPEYLRAQLERSRQRLAFQKEAVQLHQGNSPAARAARVAHVNERHRAQRALDLAAGINVPELERVKQNEARAAAAARAAEQGAEEGDQARPNPPAAGGSKP